MIAILLLALSLAVPAVAGSDPEKTSNQRQVRRKVIVIEDGDTLSNAVRDAESSKDIEAAVTEAIGKAGTMPDSSEVEEEIIVIRRDGRGHSHLCEGKSCRIFSGHEEGKGPFGFAVPFERLPKLEGMDLPGMGKRTYLGVHLQELTDQLRAYFKVKEGEGVLVSSVEKDSPAAKAGIKAGDIVTSLGGTAVKESGDLVGAVHARKTGEQVKITLLREGKSKTVEATLSEMEGSGLRLVEKELDLPDGAMRKFRWMEEDEEEDDDLEEEVDALRKEVDKLREKIESLSKPK